MEWNEGMEWNGMEWMEGMEWIVGMAFCTTRNFRLDENKVKPLYNISILNQKKFINLIQIKRKFRKFQWNFRTKEMTRKGVEFQWRKTLSFLDANWLALKVENADQFIQCMSWGKNYRQKTEIKWWKIVWELRLVTPRKLKNYYNQLKIIYN